MGTAVFGAPEFKARSGRTVRSNEDGSVTFQGVRGYIGPEQVFDAQEFFQAQRDIDFGRWRWPENPDYVVYPNPDEAFERMFGPNLDLVILRESDAMTKGYVRDEDQGGPPMDHRVGHILAARAYFEVHPERKPWHDATPGEFWSVQHMGMCETCRVDDLNGVLRFVGVDGGDTHVTMPITHHSITDALPMRIEVAS